MLKESSRTKAISKPQDWTSGGFGSGSRIGGTALAVDAGKLKNDIAKAIIAKICRAFFQPNSNLVSFTFGDFLIVKEAALEFFLILFFVVILLSLVDYLVDKKLIKFLKSEGGLQLVCV
jgi:hypothetical protein